MSNNLVLNLLAKTDGFTGPLTKAGSVLQSVFAKSIDSATQSLEQFEPSVQEALNALKNLNSGTDNSKFIDSILKDEKVLKSFITNLKSELKNVTDIESFTQLTTVLTDLENKFSQLDKSISDNENTNKSAKARLRELKEEMIKLEDAGKENTIQYQKLQVASAKLSDQLQDQAESVRALASDTFALDASVDIIQNVAAGWQTYTGIVSLVGDENEDLQKSLVTLMAVMNVAQGVQQVGNFLTGQSAGLKVIERTANYGLALSYRVLGTSAETAALGTRAFALALTSTGFGAILIAIGIGIEALVRYVQTTYSAKEATDKFTYSLTQLQNKFESKNNQTDNYYKKKIAEVKYANAETITALKNKNASESELQKQQINNEESLFKIEQQYRRKQLTDLQTYLVDRLELYRKSNKADTEERLKIQKEIEKGTQDVTQKQIEIDNAELEHKAQVLEQKSELNNKYLTDLKKQLEKLKLQEETLLKFKAAGEFDIDKQKLLTSTQSQIESVIEQITAKEVQIGIKPKIALLGVTRDKVTGLTLDEKVELRTIFNRNKQQEKDDINTALEGLGQAVDKAAQDSVDNALKDKPITLESIEFKAKENAFDKVKEQIKKSGEEIKSLWAQIGAEYDNGVVDFQGVVKKGIVDIASTIGSVLGNGGTLGDALKAGAEQLLHIIGGVLKTLGEQMIVIGNLKVALDEAINNLFGPQGAIAAVAVGVLLIGLGAALSNFKMTQSKGIKAFADGGVVMGPTLGLIGETGKPEAVIPLDRLGEVVGGIGGSAKDIFVTGNLQGEIIYLQQQRVAERRGRIV